MNNLLYIGNIPLKVKSGGDLINKRNLMALRQILKGHLFTYKLECINPLFTLINLIRGYMLGLSSIHKNKIIRMIEEDGIESVFLSSSKYGKLIKIIRNKYPSVKIYTFFHNVEQQYTLEEYKNTPSLKNKLINKVSVKNETLACKYSDIIIVLNQRDNLLLQELYGRNADLLLPTTFEDCYSKEKSIIKNDKKQINLLFVGYAFYANIEGIKWFINEVLPSFRNCKLQIVGNGMDKIFEPASNVEVHGYVDDLSSFYYQADIVVLPIFTGGGMKTKTAEALMYGCPIVGTSEAFEGYSLDYDKIGGLANTKEEMIEKINRLVDSKDLLVSAKQYARSVFVEKYSIRNTISELTKVIYGQG